ncbi:hypothetical protein [Ornithinimicrobium kibberense]|uniref:hypothetical protein n=1 Tax=Ornithinimicrobium kibberense TaxID=282060 RepID=UPI00361E2C5D
MAWPPSCSPGRPWGAEADGPWARPGGDTAPALRGSVGATSYGGQQMEARDAEPGADADRGRGGRGWESGCCTPPTGRSA